MSVGKGSRGGSYEVSRARRAEMLEIFRRCIANGEPPPKMNALAKSMGVQKSTVDRALRMLTAEGLVEVESRGSWRRVKVDGVWSETSTAKKAAKDKKPRKAAPPKRRTQSEASILRRRFLEYFVEIADGNTPLPAEADLAKRFGVPPDSVGRIIEQLRMKHAIHVETEERRRRIVIAKTGAATGWRSMGVTPQGVDLSLRGPGWTIPIPAIVNAMRFSTCQFLYGDGRERNFCGAQTRDGSSYCAEHHAVCYIKGSKKKVASAPGFEEAA